MILYHGSYKNIEKTLKPNKAFPLDDYENVVYFTDSKERAIAYAISPIDSYIKSQCGINIHCSAISAHMRDNNGVLEIMECYPNMFDIYRNGAYLYVWNGDIQPNDRNEYTTSNEVDFDEKIYIDNVFNELIKLEKMGKVKLYKYEDLDIWKTHLQYEYLESGLQNRASYCSQKEELEFFEMVCQYFPKIKNHIKMV